MGTWGKGSLAPELAKLESDELDPDAETGTVAAGVVLISGFGGFSDLAVTACTGFNTGALTVALTEGELEAGVVGCFEFELELSGAETASDGTFTVAPVVVAGLETMGRVEADGSAMEGTGFIE